VRGTYLSRSTGRRRARAGGPVDGRPIRRHPVSGLVAPVFRARGAGADGRLRWLARERCPRVRPRPVLAQVPERTCGPVRGTIRGATYRLS